MVEQVAFHGTPEEQAALLNALSRYCECVYQVGVRKTMCAGHDMLVHNQRALNGLLFMRRRLTKVRAFRSHLC